VCSPPCGWAELGLLPFLHPSFVNRQMAKLSGHPEAEDWGVVEFPELSGWDSRDIHETAVTPNREVLGRRKHLPRFLTAGTRAQCVWGTQASKLGEQRTRAWATCSHVSSERAGQNKRRLGEVEAQGVQSQWRN
jgi:hypothetical protein